MEQEQPIEEDVKLGSPRLNLGVAFFGGCIVTAVAALPIFLNIADNDVASPTLNDTANLNEALETQALITSIGSAQPRVRLNDMSQPERFAHFGQLVRDHTGGKYEPITVFDGVNGLVGIASQSAEGHVAVMWATRDARHLITGKVTSVESGEDMTMHYGMRVAPSQVAMNRPPRPPARAKRPAQPASSQQAPDKSIRSDTERNVRDISAAQFAKVAAASAVIELEPDAEAPEVMVFYDPLCGYCQELHSVIHPAIGAGEMNVRWIPVAGVGGQAAMALGSGLLGAPADQAPVQLARIAANNTEAAREVVSLASQPNTKSVAENTQLLAALVGSIQTPVIVYQGPRGPKARIGLKVGGTALEQIESAPS